MRLSPLQVVASAALLLLAPGVLAQQQQQQQQDDLIDDVVVRNRLYRPAGRLELSASAGLPVLAHLTAHYTFNAGLAYNLVDTLALEARAGWAASRHTGLARSISESFLDREDKRVTDELEDLWQLGLHGVAGVRWAPVYGKLSLLADLPVHFHAYLWAGGGLGVLRRQSVIQCTQVVDRRLGICDDRSEPLDRDSATRSYWARESRVAPVGSAALGLRFFIQQRHGLRVEVRDWVFQDAYRVGLSREDWEAGRETGTPASDPGLTHLMQFDVGYTFSF